LKSTNINCDDPINSYQDIAASDYPVHDVVNIISVYDVLNVVSYSVYKSTNGLEFEKAFKLPSGDLISWLGNSRFIRAVTGHNEICEVYPLKSGTILAFSGGYIWRSVNDGNTFQKVHKLRHFGRELGAGSCRKA
jgi:hypothetical protein